MLKKNLPLAIITTIIILLPIAAGIFLWDQLPDRIPIHWNIHGNADNYVDKTYAVFTIPVFMAAMHWFMIFVTNADPLNKNTSKKLVSLVLIIFPIISLMISTMSYSAALGYGIRINIIVPFFLGILFIVIGNYLPKAQHSHTIGIKLPWTLNSVENWERTHRFAGPVWMAGGAISAIASFTGSTIPVVISLAVVVVLPTVYSYMYYRKHEK